MCLVTGRQFNVVRSLIKRRIKQLSLQQLFREDVISPEQEISQDLHCHTLSSWNNTNLQLGMLQARLGCIETIQAVIQNSLRSMERFPITLNSF